MRFVPKHWFLNMVHPHFPSLWWSSLPLACFFSLLGQVNCQGKYTEVCLVKTDFQFTYSQIFLSLSPSFQLIHEEKSFLERGNNCLKLLIDSYKMSTSQHCKLVCLFMYGVAWQQASWHEMEDGMAPKSYLGCSKLIVSPLAIFSCLTCGQSTHLPSGRDPTKVICKDRRCCPNNIHFTL